jgi:hypothetical protein
MKTPPLASESFVGEGSLFCWQGLRSPACAYWWAGRRLPIKELRQVKGTDVPSTEPRSGEGSPLD